MIFASKPVSKNAFLQLQEKLIQIWILQVGHRWPSPGTLFTNCQEKVPGFLIPYSLVCGVLLLGGPAYGGSYLLLLPLACLGMDCWQVDSILLS